MRIVSAADMARRNERGRAREERKAFAGRWIIYKFEDENGNLAFEKIRIPLGGGEKTFRYRHWTQVEPHGMAWDYHKPPGADALLFRLPQVIRAKASGADVWWAEGEKDAGKLEEFLEGDDCATSHHQAAGNSTPEQAEWLRGHEGWVILLMDVDEDRPDGSNPGAFCVIRRYDHLREIGIPRERIAVAAPKVGKDIHDHLSAGHSLDEVVWVTDLEPLRAKAKRGNGFLSAYLGADLEMDEAMERVEREGWTVRRG